MSRAVVGIIRRRGRSGRRLSIRLRTRISASVSTPGKVMKMAGAYQDVAEEFGDPFDESEEKQENGK